jgi:hypothetical protein
MSRRCAITHQEELERRILELIQDFEMTTDCRVQVVTYDPVASKVGTVEKQPPR